MKNQPLISILIVAHNPGAYLTNTLISCLNQSYQNTEILLLDNNSHENIQKYIDQAEQITKKIGKIKSFFEKKNHGPYKGLNLLLEKAVGDYIAIQDHDDIWHSEKIEKQINFLENHPRYIGCGTKTIMYYETDKKYFEYFLGKENYYTIHPSLIFRNKNIFRYDTSITEYMCDAYSLRKNLCHNRKLITNLDESLTLHLIKKGSTNYSYKWHKLSGANIQRAYQIHSSLYATLTIGWEIQRKLLYPIIQKIGFGHLIDVLERIPFQIFGTKIKNTHGDEWWGKYVD